ncbi:MAG TPA: tRNA (adenosine(37)-N6)-threonylcarbamoyltransferase complex dimerization subunit type 1 TsaB [Thermotogota bacterium]|nr:tRNA (adenosine(37)-N6)-threonylcarbamoyltransferase complex dimerization subunit type 1 TsaB [Thermotogota bacterium]HRW34242.1 tRNA (adenosine(37)-N6)-threonylcarbamoyltransferase complex dimerization subunit type 1 TsaB [Thermotogota bacterium]
MFLKSNQKNLVLFLDAATEIFYIAIWDLGTGAMVQKQFNHREIKGEALLSVIKSLFDETGYDVHSVAYLCTTKGPGSLTGLRIAMSILKTMAQILNVPIVSLPTLYALEQSYVQPLELKSARIMTCLMARKNSYYVRFSDSNEDCFEQISGEMLIQALKNVNISLWAQSHLSQVPCDKQPDKSVIIGLSPLILFGLFEKKYQQQDTVNYLNCHPEYAGKSVAEVNFEVKKK